MNEAEITETFRRVVDKFGTKATIRLVRDSLSQLKAHGEALPGGGFKSIDNALQNRNKLIDYELEILKDTIDKLK